MPLLKPTGETREVGWAVPSGVVRVSVFPTVAAVVTVAVVPSEFDGKRGPIEVTVMTSDVVCVAEGDCLVTDLRKCGNPADQRVRHGARELADALEEYCRGHCPASVLSALRENPA